MTALQNSPAVATEVAQQNRTDRVQAVRRFAYVALLSGALLLSVAFAVGLQVRTWNYLAIGAASGVTVLLSAAGYLLSRGERLNLAAWLILIGLGLSLPAVAAAVSQTGIFLAVVGGVLLPILLRGALPARSFSRAVFLSLGLGLVALLIDLFNPTGRLALPLPELAIIALDSGLVLLSLLSVAQRFNEYSLQTKLVLTLLGVSVLPLAFLAFLNGRSIRSALREEANEKLFSAASQTAVALDAFIQTRLADIQSQGQYQAYSEYLALPASARSGSEEEARARALLFATTRRVPVEAQSIALLDSRGRNVLDTRQENIGQDESAHPYFGQAVEIGLPYASPVLVTESSSPSLFFSQSVRSRETGDVVGVLRSRYSLDSIQSRVIQNQELAGEDSFAVVFDEHYIHVAHSAAPETIMQAVGPLTAQEEEELIAANRLPDLPSEQLTTNLPELVEKLEGVDQSPFFEAEDVATGTRVNQVAVVEMETQPWLVAFFQPQDVLFAPAASQARSTLLLAVVLAGVVSVLAVTVSQVVSRPILELTDTAQRISEGDLEAEAVSATGDELGLLAKTFNSMTARLRDLIGGLEDRVAERTTDLERRASQLQAASDVAKDAAAVRDVDRLLNETVHNISRRFGYYHAGVFLIDEEGDFAVLQAASSEGGQRMLEREHKLAVGKVGLVGYVTGTGKPRIALDVGEDAVHFANPDLPDTRSELTLPLLSGERVIGALDVQSAEPNAFDDQDVIALQTMADQLAIAIENARLLARQTELAADRRRAIDVYRQLSASMSYDQILADTTRLIRANFEFERVTLSLVEGNEVVIRSASASSQARLPRLGDSVPVGQGLIGRAVSSMGPVRIDDSTPDLASQVDPALGQLEASLAVPLVSRGQAIGALAVERTHERIYDDNDIELVELLASQAAVSIENARLFEETQQRLRQVDALYRRQTAESWELLVNARRVQGQENRAAFGDEEVEADGKEPIEAPISLRGEVIGKLDVMPRGREEWTEEDFEILEDVADEVAGQLEQLRLVEEIQRRATQLETAAEIARVATGLLDLDTLLKQAVNLIQERFGFYHVAVYLVERAGNTAFIREASGDIGEALTQTRRRFEVGSRTVIGFVTGSGEFYVAHDAETDPYYRNSNLLPDSESELAVPLKIGERIVGALDVHDAGKYAFSEDDITVLETLADQIAVAVENARLFQDALQRAEREQSVVQITGKIRASEDIDSILRTAVEEMRQALGARRATIRLAPDPSDARSNGQDRPQVTDGRGPDTEMDSEAQR